MGTINIKKKAEIDRENEIKQLENDISELQSQLDELAKDYNFALMFNDTAEQDLIKEERDKVLTEIKEKKSQLEEL